MDSPYLGIVPYLFFDDADPAMDWYQEVFGFEELGRWRDDAGKTHNGEMRVGSTELWVDGTGARLDTDPRPTWIGIWVDDVEAAYERILKANITCEPPVEREFGVEMITVPDPFGYLWGFMRRIPLEPTA